MASLVSGTGTSRRRRWIWLFAGLLVFLAVAWLHHRFVVHRLNYANKDFMSLWTGGRAILRGLNPYQLEVWGPLRAEYGSTWMPDPRAPFPLWTFLVMVPFALLPLGQAAAAWLTFQELLLVVSLVALIRGVGDYSPSPVEVGLLALGAFLSVSTVLVLINGQMTYLLLAILVLIVLLARQERYVAAGLTLSLLALKPNPFILFVPLFGLWLLWRKQWRVVGGAALGGLMLLGGSWLVQPGWLPQWLNVRSKTEVVTITPTIWGLAAELSAGWWLPLGLLLAISMTVVVALYLLRRPHLNWTPVVALGVAASLLVTPYTWAYEHALLYLPWLWIFVCARHRRQAQLLWLALAWLLPWIFFSIAAARIRDTFAFVIPLLTLLATIWLLETASPAPNPERLDAE